MGILQLVLSVCVLLGAVLFTAWNLFEFFSDWDWNLPEDLHLNMDEQLTRHGYPHEIHYIETEDHYILKCYRIQKCPTNKGLPLILMPGLFCNSLDFLVAGEEAALGYLAAKACYDTWICNNRGNFESRNNTKLDPNKPEFWRYSWHEMGIYDMPAVIDHILKTSGADKVNYIGHSEGTTEAFVLCSLLPQFCKEKINHIHALAPVAIMKHSGQPVLKALAKNVNEEKKLLEPFLYEFLPKSSARSRLVPVACSTDIIRVDNPCSDFLIIGSGDDPEQFNKTTMQLAMANFPAGSSLNQSVHYAQNMNSDDFQFYDHNADSPDGNMKFYGQPTPPRYPVENIETDVTLYYALNDMLTNYTDVLKLSELMTKSNVKKVQIKNPNFGHTNFIYAKDVKTLVNDIVLANLEE